MVWNRYECGVAVWGMGPLAQRVDKIFELPVEAVGTFHVAQMPRLRYDAQTASLYLLLHQPCGLRRRDAVLLSHQDKHRNRDLLQSAAALFTLA